MCTLTFFPLSKNDFILTSNRDEQPSRETIPPKEYNHEGITLIYPKDKRAGGTWIGANKEGRVASLMNGGKIPHKRKEKYRLSRGVVMLELLKATDVFNYLDTFDFHGIEPFTLVFIESTNTADKNSNKPSFLAFELIWDEKKLHRRELEWKPQIWSSTPLYTREDHQIRTEWFTKFIKENSHISPEAIWEFHHTAGNGDKKIGLIMDREIVHTKSITQIVKKEDIRFLYKDVLR